MNGDECKQYNRQKAFQVKVIQKTSEGPEQFWTSNELHRCPEGAKDNTDTIAWPVGMFGHMFPGGKEFWVRAECPACGLHITRMFKWRSPLIVPVSRG